VDYRSVGDGKMGPVTSQLYQLFQDVLLGKVQKYKHWVTPVYEK
jgi:branched-chain amino acid aminotransferase